MPFELRNPTALPGLVTPELPDSLTPEEASTLEELGEGEAKKRYDKIMNGIRPGIRRSWWRRRPMPSAPSRIHPRREPFATAAQRLP